MGGWIAETPHLCTRRIRSGIAGYGKVESAFPDISYSCAASITSGDFDIKFPRFESPEGSEVLVVGKSSTSSIPGETTTAIELFFIFNVPSIFFRFCGPWRQRTHITIVCVSPRQTRACTRCAVVKFWRNAISQQSGVSCTVRDI